MVLWQQQHVWENIMGALQLALHQFHHQLLAVMLKLGLAWDGTWQLVPLPAAPNMSLYQLQYTHFGLMGKGSFGSVF